MPHSCFLVEDNASVPGEVGLCPVLARKDITLIKLPGYSYDLNPVEMVFGQAKVIARSSSGFLRRNPMVSTVNFGIGTNPPP